MTDYKPLTPKFRKEILDSINEQVAELNECENNAFKSIYQTGFAALRTIIEGLPDGYPMPLKERR